MKCVLDYPPSSSKIINYNRTIIIAKVLVAKFTVSQAAMLSLSKSTKTTICTQAISKVLQRLAPANNLSSIQVYIAFWRPL